MGDDPISSLERAIAVIEAQRAILGDDLVEAALAPLRARRESLLPVEGVEARKLVTILFADLVSYTEMAEKMDPEDVREVLNAYFARWSAILEAHGGEVEKFIGDAVMAVFGLGASREDDPERAVRAGLEMRQALEELNLSFTRRGLPNLQMRVGIHTGQVVISRLGERRGQDFVVVGDAVNLASRLQGAAPRGGILLSHDTYRHVRGAFDLQPLPPITVKGYTRPVQVYLALQPKPRTFRMTARGVEGVETRMVGRDSELARLQSALRLAQGSGEGEQAGLRTVTLLGEAGLGKSRLIYEFSNWLDLIPERIYYFRGRAVPSMQSSPFALLRDVFAERFGIAESDGPEQTQRKMAEGIGKPEKAALISRVLGYETPAEPRPSRQKDDDPRVLRDQALAAAVEYFRELSGRQPVVILLEDLHWADDSSVEAIERVAGAMARMPVLIVFAARPELLERRPDWGQRFPHDARLFLKPLTRAESHDLVREILQRVVDLPESLCEIIVQHADGNPFYVEELIKMLIEDGVIVKSEESWSVIGERLAGVRVPPTLTEVLQARFDSLPPEERLLLQRAAVIGRVFWDRAVEAIGAASSSNGVSLAGLEEIRRREVIDRRERSAFENSIEYMFRHSLQRDVTYESILKRERRAYHALAARWLEEAAGRDQRAGEYSALIADHYDRAEETALAARWYLKAGAHASERFANQEALRLFGRALNLIPAEDTAGRCQALIGRVQVYHRLAEREAQRADLDALEALSPKLDGAEQVEFTIEKSRYYDALGDLSTSGEYALQAAEQARTLGMDAAEASAWIFYGVSLWRRSRYQEAIQPLEEALHLAHARGLEFEEAEALRNLGIISEALGELEKACREVEQALAIHRKIGNRRGESMSLNSLGALMYSTTRYDLARSYMEQGLVLKRQMGDRRGQHITLNNLSLVALAQGHHVQAHRYAQETLTLAQETNDREGAANVEAILAAIALYQGDFQQARAMLDRSLPVIQSIDDRHLESELRSAYGVLALNEGNPAEALSQARSALELARQAKVQSAEGRAQMVLGLAQLALRDLDAAESALLQAQELRKAEGHPWRLLEVQAGQVCIAIQRGDISSALALADQMAGFLESPPPGIVEQALLYDVDDPVWIYWTLQRALSAAGDPRAAWALKRAVQCLDELASQFEDEPARHRFLLSSPARRQVAEVSTTLNKERAG